MFETAPGKKCHVHLDARESISRPRPADGGVRDFSSASAGLRRLLFYFRSFQSERLELSTSNMSHFLALTSRARTVTAAHEARVYFSFILGGGVCIQLHSNVQ